METIMKILIVLCCLLIVFLGTVSVFFLKHRTSPRPGTGRPNASTGSSSRSRMAARWAHMGDGSRRGRDDSSLRDEQTDNNPIDESVKPNSTRYDGQPDDFGSFARLDHAHRARSQASLPSSLVGSGPNGSRTLLMGWFGLDEPIGAGYNTRSEPKEKTLDGEALPMRATDGTDMEDPYQRQSVVPLHRVPTTEDYDWETHSETTGA